MQLNGGHYRRGQVARCCSGRSLSHSGNFSDKKLTGNIAAKVAPNTVPYLQSSVRTDMRASGRYDTRETPILNLFSPIRLVYSKHVSCDDIRCDVLESACVAISCQLTYYLSARPCTWKIISRYVKGLLKWTWQPRHSFHVGIKDRNTWSSAPHSCKLLTYI